MAEKGIIAYPHLVSIYLAISSPDLAFSIKEGLYLPNAQSICLHAHDRYGQLFKGTSLPEVWDACYGATRSCPRIYYLAIQFYEHRTTESANGHHLDLHSYPEILAFIQCLRNSAALLNVQEDRAEWRDILKRCGLEDPPSESTLLEEIASIPLPPEDLDIWEISAQPGLHSVNIPHLLGQVEQIEKHWNTAPVNMADSESSQSSSPRCLNRRLLRDSPIVEIEGTISKMVSGVDPIGIVAIPNGTAAPVDKSGQ